LNIFEAAPLVDGLKTTSIITESEELKIGKRRTFSLEDGEESIGF